MTSTIKINETMSKVDRELNTFAAAAGTYSATIATIKRDLNPVSDAAKDATADAEEKLRITGNRIVRTIDLMIDEAKRLYTEDARLDPARDLPTVTATIDFLKGRNIEEVSTDALTDIAASLCGRTAAIDMIVKAVPEYAGFFEPYMVSETDLHEITKALAMLDIDPVENRFSAGDLRSWLMVFCKKIGAVYPAAEDASMTELRYQYIMKAMNLA